MSYQFPYLDAHQSRTQDPTQWQMELAAALEGIFAGGAHSLDALIDGLNASRVRPPDGGNWTAEKYTTLMRKLGA